MAKSKLETRIELLSTIHATEHKQLDDFFRTSYRTAIRRDRQFMIDLYTVKTAKLIAKQVAEFRALLVTHN